MPLFAGPLPDWLHCLGPPDTSGRIRAVPEDFEVWELPLIEPQGAGTHLWLEVRKRGANTQWVAGQLAASAGVAQRDVGFAGMKDRHAVTTQWFSVALQEAANSDWQNWDIPGVILLQARRHGRKLQRGALRGNRFRIRVRDLQGNAEGLPNRIDALARSGVPNYFGPQRFGRNGANVARAVRWLERGNRIRRSELSIYLSALRSYLFNLLLAERVRQGNWNQLVAGDVAMLDGSRSTFACESPGSELQQRCADFDIHPTGPLPGRVPKRRGGDSSGEAASIEQSVLGRHEALVTALEKSGVDAGRRSLRALPSALAWQFHGTELVLEFALPPGTYATSVLRELVLTDPVTISEGR